MKYILEYLEEERFITFVPDANIEYKEEFADDCIPIGYRIIVNGKDIEIVVWYADYFRWLENKFNTNIDKLCNWVEHNVWRKPDARDYKDNTKFYNNFDEYINNFRNTIKETFKI